MVATEKKKILDFGFFENDFDLSLKRTSKIVLKRVYRLKSISIQCTKKERKKKYFILTLVAVVEAPALREVFSAALAPFSVGDFQALLFSLLEVEAAL
jgi:hypothetical protein